MQHRWTAEIVAAAVTVLVSGVVLVGIGVWSSAAEAVARPAPISSAAPTAPGLDVAAAAASDAAVGTAGAPPSPAAPGGAGAAALPFAGERITYGPDPAQYLNVFVPGPGSHPTIVWLHGGGWIQGDDLPVPPPILAQVGRGYTVASVQYRMAPLHPFPAAVDDVQDALRFLAQAGPVLGVAPARIVVAGASAGGNLAAEVSTVWDRPGYHGGADVRPAAFLSISGPLDLSYFSAHSIWSPVAAAYVPGEAPRLLAAASPLDNVGPGDPPGYLVYGTADEVVPAGPSVAQMAARYGELVGPGRLQVDAVATPGCSGHDPTCGADWGAIERFLDASVGGAPARP